MFESHTFTLRGKKSRRVIFMNVVLAAPENRAKGSLPEDIAEAVYKAATDGKDQLRYLAGRDAKEYYARRLEQGDEVFRKDFDQRLFGQ